MALDFTEGLSRGLEAVRGLRQAVPDVSLILMSDDVEPSHITQAFQAGVAGYVTKRALASELAPAIRHVLKGRPYISAGMEVNMIELLIAATGPDSIFADRVTPRQREVLEMVAANKSR